jgi:hypothetical protein
LEKEQKGEEARAKALKKELDWVATKPQRPPSQEQGAYRSF